MKSLTNSMSHKVLHRRPIVAGAALAAASLCLCWAGAAAAEETWSHSFGVGVYDQPKFPGADANYAQPLPYFDVRYGDHLFFNAVQGLGVQIGSPQDRWLSASLGPDLTHRDQSDDARLAGLGDVHYTGRLWLQAGSSFQRFTATATLGRDLFHEGQGTVADLEFYARAYPTETLEIDHGLAWRWADGEYTRTFFGVDSQQSLRSSLPQYAAGSGIASAGLFVRLRYALAADWMLVSNLDWTRLEGDAVDSPITESRDRFSLGLFLVHVI